MPEATDPKPAYAVSYLTHSIPASLPAGENCRATVEVRNTGSKTWEVHITDGCAINLTLHFGGEVRSFELPYSVNPDERVRIALNFVVPLTEGATPLIVNMVRQNFAFFSDLGSSPLGLLPNVIKEAANNYQGLAAPLPFYGAEFIEHSAPNSVDPKSRFGVWVRIRNFGSMQWETNDAHGRHVSVVAAIDRHVVVSAPLPCSVATSQDVDVHMVVPAPATPGCYSVSINLVHEGVAFFGSQGVSPLVFPLVVRPTPQPAAAHLYDIALRSNSAFYHPSGGVSRLADGTWLPQVLEHAKGSHVWDSDGRRYIDYTMGWGCALLGHGHNLVEAAVRRAMGVGPTLPLPHRLELELTEELCQQAEIPCAEAVAFGKNGSDVCSLAIRLARLATGRKTILTCGYHGWQDWYAEPLGFSGTGVPERDPHLVVRIGYNDIASLQAAISTHRADLAGVILEPSGASGGPGMVGGDADIAFLSMVAAETRAAGGLVIFDEIITGFRYVKGSVQKATGIVPDLACFGKALGNGFPISALLGRSNVLQLMSRAFYGPTFKGEIYSIAAARMSLAVYRSEPVADHVWWYGRQLEAALTRLCVEIDIEATVVGPPFRMALRFDEPDPHRRKLIRTLYIQELLRGGLITYNGVMLPSYAHSDVELAETLSVMKQALTKVRLYSQAEDGDLHRVIEIPLVE